MVVDAWWWMHGGGCMVVDAWWWVHGGGCMMQESMAGFSQQWPERLIVCMAAAAAACSAA